MIIRQQRIASDEALCWLQGCDENFCPPKWSLERLEKYASKLSTFAFWTYLLKEDGGKIGFVAYYLNEENKTVYISIIAVAKNFRRFGYGRKLLQNLIESVSEKYKDISLEVSKNNGGALSLYQSFGFALKKDRGEKVLMTKYLN